MNYLEKLIAIGSHDGLCENCGKPIPLDNVVEGDLGWYCSDNCMSEVEGSNGMTEAECRAWERKQLGIGG